MRRYNAAAGSAILAAAFYALNSPLSKLLLRDVPPAMMAAFLYLGAGLGMALIVGVKRISGRAGGEKPLTRELMPYVAGMIALDIAAPIFLMTGLARASAANVSLLNNFEIVATSLIAMAVFRERISGRLWAAICLITLASVLLSLEGSGSLRFSSGSLMVLCACVCWGFENNCTRRLSECDPSQIVVVKGIGSGAGSLIVALLAGEGFAFAPRIPAILLLGFVAYGLSVYFYVYAQRYIGAARTSAYYAIAPFIGAALSFVIFRERPGALFCAALIVMAAGMWLLNEKSENSPG